MKIIAQAETIVTNRIICGLCGGAGHITSDCKMKKTSSAENGDEESAEKIVTWSEREKMDTEVIKYLLNQI